MNQRGYLVLFAISIAALVLGQHFHSDAAEVMGTIGGGVALISLL